jgi:signal peptidase
MKKIANIIFYVVMLSLIAGCGYIFLDTKNHPGASYRTYFGVSPMRIISGSMEPKYPIGTIVFAHKEKTYNVGDIISYNATDEQLAQGSPKTITHRIIEQKDGGYIMQGDNNPVPDAQIVMPADVVGKVSFYLPFTLKQYIVFGIALILLMYLVPLLFKPSRKKIPTESSTPKQTA